MRITITIEPPYDAELKDLNEWQLGLLLRDALGEFVAHRGPSPTAYVEQRYPDREGFTYTGEARTRKIRQVTQRIRWAEALHHGDVAMVEHEGSDE